jgi:hypothetical protein
MINHRILVVNIAHHLPLRLFPRQILLVKGCSAATGTYLRQEWQAMSDLRAPPSRELSLSAHISDEVEYIFQSATMKREDRR